MEELFIFTAVKEALSKGAEAEEGQENFLLAIYGDSPEFCSIVIELHVYG